ncbi:hypothetical protein OC846_006133 [Tilletia horrida]|uniref:Dynactin subunit 4 n=1 Tax=Tilletia horrida TaxID=155126 RepID=A0AAN6JP96_9BASI|nr:hypothetical protein OC846_006133 [Tilletia horrida]
MFTIQSSHIKEQRNRCDRNCFSCPICTNTLITVPSDPDEDFPPESKEASMGGAPYYLFCTCCKWDSKEIKLEFERPTGLSMQLQKSEEQSADALELQALQDHFSAVLKVNAGANNSSSNVLDPSGSSHRATPATLRASKLLRDVPALASNSKYLHGGRSQGLSTTLNRNGVHDMFGGSGGGGGGGRPEPITEWVFVGDPKPYEAKTNYVPDGSGGSSRGTGSALGGGGGLEGLSVLGRREESNRSFVAATGDDQLITSLEQRWTLPTFPPRVQDLRPQRVAASYRATKRCSVCNHICIRPDTKSGFHRFKIKTFFANYVPDITVSPSPLQVIDPNSADPLLQHHHQAASTLSRLARNRNSIGIRASMGGGGIGANDGSRIGGRPSSVFGAAGLGLGPGGLPGAGTSGLPSSSAGSSVVAAASTAGGSSASLLAPRAIDVENLRPGAKYSFDLVFTNPLNENMNVSIVIAKPSAAASAGPAGFAVIPPASALLGGANAPGGPLSPYPISEARSPRSPTGTSSETPLSPGGTGTGGTGGGFPGSTPLRLPWQVTPSAEVFPVASNMDLLDDLDVAAALNLDGEDDDDGVDDGLLEEDDEDDGAEVEAYNVDGDGTGSAVKSRRTSVKKGGMKKRRRKAAYKQSGHRTTITLELALGSDASGEIEFGLFVSYNTYPEGSAPPPLPTSPTKGGALQAGGDKGLAFWTAVHLGKCAPRIPATSGETVMSPGGIGMGTSALPGLVRRTSSGGVGHVQGKGSEFSAIAAVAEAEESAKVGDADAVPAS